MVEMGLTKSTSLSLDSQVSCVCDSLVMQSFCFHFLGMKTVTIAKEQNLETRICQRPLISFWNNLSYE